MFVPMGIDALVTLGVAPVLLCAAAGLITFGLLPAAIDGLLYYGAAKPVSAVANFLLYNALGSGGGGAGANLYGEQQPPPPSLPHSASAAPPCAQPSSSPTLPSRLVTLQPRSPIL